MNNTPEHLIRSTGTRQRKPAAPKKGALAPSPLVMRVAYRTNMSVAMVYAVIYGKKRNPAISAAVDAARKEMNLQAA